MKNFKSLLLTLLPLSLLGNIISPDKEFSKEIYEEFSINADASINLDTKHGDITFKTANIDRAIFEVTILTDADSQEDAEDIFDAIQVNFDANSSSVDVEVEIGENKSRKGWFGNWFSWNNNSRNFEVNFEITIPESVNLNIDHAFGDVLIPNMRNDIELDFRHANGRLNDVEGNAIVELRHGKISMGNTSDIEVDIAHGDFIAGNVNIADIEMAHSDLELKSIESLDLESSHSDVVADRVGELINDGQFTDFEIEYLNDANFDCNFCDIEIQLLNSNGEFDMQHGKLAIDEFSVEADYVNIDGQHSNFYLTTDSGFQIDYEGSHVKPKFSDWPEFRRESKDGADYEYEGSYGNSPQLKIEVDIQHGSFKINN